MILFHISRGISPKVGATFTGTSVHTRGPRSSRPLGLFFSQRGQMALVLLRVSRDTRRHRPCAIKWHWGVEHVKASWARSGVIALRQKAQLPDDDEDEVSASLSSSLSTLEGVSQPHSYWASRVVGMQSAMFRPVERGALRGMRRRLGVGGRQAGREGGRETAAGEKQLGGLL